MIIALSEQQQQRAQDLQSQIFGKLRNPDNYTGQKDKDRFQKGYSGEFAAETMFTRAGIRYDFNVVANGRSNSLPEFTIYQKGIPITVDIKTAGEANHQFFLVPKAQDWQKSQIYIGMHLLTPSCFECFGFLYSSEVSALPVKPWPPNGVPTRFKLGSELRPIGLLLALADQKTQIPC